MSVEMATSDHFRRSTEGYPQTCITDERQICGELFSSLLPVVTDQHKPVKASTL